MATLQKLLKKAHSPEQAAGRSKLEGFASVSHETLYKRIYADKAGGRTLWTTLGCCKKRRKRSGSGRQGRGKISNRMGVKERCSRVEQCASIGHWEGDTIIGRKQKYALVSLVERKKDRDPEPYKPGMIVALDGGD